MQKCMCRFQTEGGNQTINYFADNLFICVEKRPYCSGFGCGTLKTWCTSGMGAGE